MSKRCQGNAAECETWYRSECHTLHCKTKKYLRIIWVTTLASRQREANFAMCMSGERICLVSSISRQIRHGDWTQQICTDWRASVRIVVPRQEKMNPCQMQLIKQCAVAFHCYAELFAMCKVNESVQTVCIWWTRVLLQEYIFEGCFLHDIKYSNKPFEPNHAGNCFFWHC